MKAIVRETYGSPEVLHLEEIPLPIIGDGDVLVRVQAASANAGDWHLLRGTPLPFRIVARLLKPKIKIMGNDIAGCVEAVGRTGSEDFPPCGTVWHSVRIARHLPLPSQPDSFGKSRPATSCLGSSNDS